MDLISSAYKNPPPPPLCSSLIPLSLSLSLALLFPCLYPIQVMQVAQPHHFLLSPTPFSPSPHISKRRTTTSLRITSRAATMYEMLSVTESAGPDEIKVAFRKLARTLHPDTCRSTELEEKKKLTQQFIRAREAYRVLSDPVLREDYDYRLRNGLALSRQNPMTRRNCFGDWEWQLEELARRSFARECSFSSSWGRRMRAAAAASSARRD